MIGVFDSGVGGMTVARAIEQLLPQYPLVYFGDLARTPYGSKSADTIAGYSCQNTEFLLEQGAKLIVVACNTAAYIASDLLRQRFEVPIFEVITPAVHTALRCTTNGRIGVIGTRATIRSGVYERTIKEQREDAQVYSQACPLLVPLVEEGWLDKRETKMIVRRYLQPLKNNQVDTFVLGCTHYPLLKEIIQARIGKQVQVIDSSAALAAELRDYLDQHPDLARELAASGQPSRYYVSDITEAATAIAQRIFGRPLTLEKVLMDH